MSFRYVPSSQDLLTNVPLADEGVMLVGVARAGQLPMVGRMKVLSLTPAPSFTPLKLHGLQWSYSRCVLVQERPLPGSDVLLFVTCHPSTGWLYSIVKVCLGRSILDFIFKQREKRIRIF